MRRKKSQPETAATPTGKPESPDRAAKATGVNEGRRKLISRIGLGATLLAMGGQAFALFRSLVPNVLYEDPQRFKVGTLDQFGEGAKFLEDKRVFIFREGKTMHCISAECTHLGCTVKMNRLNQPKKVNVGGREITEQVEFACPCHGSKYYGDGTNYSGPAPRPLEHFKLEVAPEDGQLVVDTSQTVSQDFRLTV
ncbi:MAG TPA: Rieske 2Fe-2S domain-containing protein [Pyrinomonadaceae bacterium]